MKPRGDYISGDIFSFLSDKRAYQDWFNDEESSRDILDHVKKAALLAIQRELTDTQRTYIMLYLVDRKSIREIADMYDVNISTVSRTIMRGRTRLFRCLRYSAPWLLNAKMPDRNRN